MPNLMVVLRSRNLYVDLGQAGEIWGCNFFGRCKSVISETVPGLSNVRAAVTLHEWPQAERREKTPAWISEKTMGALHLGTLDGDTGERDLQLSVRVPPEIYRKALETNFAHDDLLVYVQFTELKAAAGGENAFIETARIHFHTRVDSEHGLFGPVNSGME
jgi:hypothetical protein